MKFEDVEFYNEKTKVLTLITKVTNHKEREVATKEYHYPFFVKGIYTQKAIEIGAELEQAEFTVNEEMFNKMSNFFVELYGKQFTAKELVEGIDQSKIINTFILMLFGVLAGDVKNG